MKTRIKILGISSLIVAAVCLTAFDQKEKGNENKQEQKQEKGKGQDKGNKGRGNDNNGKGNGNAERNGNNRAQEKKNERENRGNADRNFENKGNGNNEGKRNEGSKNRFDEDRNYGKVKKLKGKDLDVYNNLYVWDRATFRERERMRNNEKVTICHKFDSDEPAVTIRVSTNAQKAHIAHGDLLGECPDFNRNGYSDIFWDRRNDYYNNLYNSYEQVSYSRSILDYALERLTASRLQLSNMRQNNYPLTEIERKQQTVVELEENVSLLETLLGAAANLLVDRL